MQDIAQFTRTDPTERISKYNTFIRRILTTPKVNIFIKILMSKKEFPLIFNGYLSLQNR